MINAALAQYKQYQKKRHQNNPLFSTQKKYAFIGVGMHSLSNLYPVLHHWGIHLKYVFTPSSEPGDQLKRQFPQCTFIHTLATILEDDEVEAVFVSSNPASHFQLLQQLALAKKKIFIEKPPCQSLVELHELLNLAELEICKVGFQRRYWAGNKPIISKLKSAKTYNAVFHFGSYISGDPYTELFIHLLDYCIFLFGPCQVLSSSIAKFNQAETLQLHLKHHNGITGLVETSTHYSWNNISEQLTVNCTNEKLLVNYPLSVKGILKPKRLLNIPSERVFKQPETTIEYFSTGNMVAPVADLNTIFLQGFYTELETFIRLVEHLPVKSSKNDLPALVPLYQLLERINYR